MCASSVNSPNFTTCGLAVNCFDIVALSLLGGLITVFDSANVI